MKIFSSLFLLLLLQLLPAPATCQVVINEFMATNALTIADPDFQNDADWIELYNAGSTTVNLSNYALTDNATDSLKWFIPAGTTIAPGAWLLFWADGRNTGLHTSFNLSKDGEEVALFNAGGQKIDAVTFSTQEVDVSYGRKTDGSVAFGYFTQATPGAANNTTSYNGFALFNPTFSPKGGFYTAPVTVTLSNTSGIGIIRYTLDGSAPTDASAAYTGPLAITTTTVVRARIFRPGMIPGPIATHTYFINEHFDERRLPVLSLSTDPAYFFDPQTGLYVQNFKPDWEYPIHLEFYEPDGLPGFQFDAGVELGGENAWILPQKLLNLHARKQYGGGSVEYQVFPDNPRADFEDLILRCSGNDWSNTFFRDGLQQGLTQPNMDVDIQDFRPVSVFLNGQYLGLHNLRSREDVEYIKWKFQADGDSIDIIENQGGVLEGNDQAYQQMVTRLNAGVAGDVDFAQLSDLMDVDNYTDYIISQIFCANSSWGHNITCFRKQNGGKFRWFLYDYDRGFFPENAGSYEMNWATTTTGASWSNPDWATMFLRKMLENNQYKQHFLRRFSDHLFVTYNQARINPVVDHFAERIAVEMEQYQIPRWVGTTSSYGNAIPNFSYWQNEVSRLKTFGVSRNNFMFSNLQSFFNIPGPAPLQLSVSAPEHGFIYIDSLLVPTYPWAGNFLKMLPFELEAVAKPGFQFVRWEKLGVSDISLIAAGSDWNYRDAATAPPADWNQPDFNFSSWTQGAAQFGYGDGDEQSQLNPGVDNQNKTPAYYFRRQFEVADPAAVSALQLDLIVDDGAVVYLNGSEVARFNMPTGTTGFNSLALTAISGADESSWKSFELSTNELLPGSNTLAVEVHQSALNSSDVSFDARLSAQYSGSATVVGANPKLALMLENDDPSAYRAVFEPTGICTLPDTVKTNLTLTVDCSPYYAAADITIQPGVQLTIEAGVELIMPQDADLWVLGGLDILGTENAPVLIRPAVGASKWGGIQLKSPTYDVHLSNFKLDRASSGAQRVYFPAAISAYHANVFIDHFDGTELLDNPVFGRFSDITMTDSKLKLRVTGDGINVKNGFGRVENCQFEGAGAVDADGIDFDGVTNGVMRNNTLQNFLGVNNDGLDIGEQCENLIIEKNFIFHCADKGISIGQQSSATIRDNTIAYCALGIGLKDQSEVTVDHNTFFGNYIGVSAYEKHPGDLGGNGIITNCISSNNATASFFSDTTAQLSIANCLTDTDTLSGNNLLSDPKFSNPTWYNFSLQADSPCLGAGTGGSDIGSGYHPAFWAQPQPMFSEIMYNDSLSNAGEFLEIHNPGSEIIDLTGYSIAQAVDFAFPEGTSLMPGEYLIVARNSNQFSGPYQVFEWTDGKLANEGEILLLLDPSGLAADYVRYNNHNPWPEENTTYGRSLELVSETLDNHLASSWKVSPTGGTPGAPVSVGVSPGISNSSVQMSVYPTPASETARIILEGCENGNYKIEVVDILGKKVWSESIEIDGGIFTETLLVSAWPSGMYTMVLYDRYGRLLQNVIVLRQ